MKVHLFNTYSFHQQGKRGNQEDARYPDHDVIEGSQKFFVVCDGVGGSEKGEVASNTVCSSIAHTLSGVDLDKIDFDKSCFSNVFDSAYDALDKAGGKLSIDMATTMTFLCFHQEGCLMAHVGDSRIYQIRQHEGIIYRSEDHSLVSTMVHSGVISPEQAENHPQSNVITRSMEPASNDVDRCMATVFNTKDIHKEDYFFMCSDGVLHKVSDDKLVEILDSEESDMSKIKTLAQLSKDSPDNNTAILIHVKSVENGLGEELDNISGSTSTTKILRKPCYSSEVVSEPHKSKGIVGWIKRNILTFVS